MNQEKFAKIAESLRQYRRAELRDFEAEIGSKPVDQLYVDPLPGGAVLRAVMSSNTTFILGRKGTGKSTVFAKAQSELRKRKDLISIYIDVKSILDILGANQLNDAELATNGISKITFKAHILRKIMLGKVISEMLNEIKKTCDNLTIIDKWKGAKRQYDELFLSLQALSDKVKSAELEKHEIPILQKISSQIASKNSSEQTNTTQKDYKIGGGVSPAGPSINGGMGESLTDFDRALEDHEIYNEYSDVVLRSFPFSDIIDEIRDLISEAGLNRLVVFFDDFSELAIVDQRLFVDVVLSPLNNSSNETIKLKVAGYPGRVYYGKIDPGKADTIFLDFSELYEANEVQEMEVSASDYAFRLLSRRFEAFNTDINEYFEGGGNLIHNHMNMMFRASFNVPRIMGHILHTCYLDRISRNEKINGPAIRLAAKKYYENVIYKYFDRLNRYALEPFENKLDRHNQQQLLKSIINEARTVRKRIVEKQVGGRYFDDLGSNPQTSHFIVSPELEDVFSSLESNFFLSRYKSTRDKSGNDVMVYALFFGLCESERMNWGYPEGREYRNYFVQRCFDYTRAVHEFLSRNQTIKCGSCGHCFPMESKPSIELYKWRCPECMEGTCDIVQLADDFKVEVEKLNQEIMLEPVELDIVYTLYEENREMRAGEISSLIDTTHQMVGKRTSKLQEMGLIRKERSPKDGQMRNQITQRCKSTYVNDTDGY